MNKTCLLNHDEINLKLDRIAWQILENHVNSNCIILVGLVDRGATIAEKLKNIIEKNASTARLSYYSVESGEKILLN